MKSIALLALSTVLLVACGGSGEVTPEHAIATVAGSGGATAAVGVASSADASSGQGGAATVSASSVVSVASSSSATSSSTSSGASSGAGGGAPVAVSIPAGCAIVPNESCAGSDVEVIGCPAAGPVAAGCKYIGEGSVDTSWWCCPMHSCAPYSGPDTLGQKCVVCGPLQPLSPPAGFATFAGSKGMGLQSEFFYCVGSP